MDKHFPISPRTSYGEIGNPTMAPSSRLIKIALRNRVLCVCSYIGVSYIQVLFCVWLLRRQYGIRSSDFTLQLSKRASLVTRHQERISPQKADFCWMLLGPGFKRRRFYQFGTQLPYSDSSIGWCPIKSDFCIQIQSKPPLQDTLDPTLKIRQTYMRSSQENSRVQVRTMRLPRQFSYHIKFTTFCHAST